MRSSDIPDPHIEFKRHFVKVVENYLSDPTDRKQKKLYKIVGDAIRIDQSLLFWFNAMFKWRNTKAGMHVEFRNNPSTLFY